jgi:hypothetical protein
MQTRRLVLMGYWGWVPAAAIFIPIQHVCAAAKRENKRTLTWQCQVGISPGERGRFQVASPHLSTAIAWKGMCGLYAQGAVTSLGFDGAGTQLTTGPTIFTRSLRRLQGGRMAQHATTWKGVWGCCTLMHQWVRRGWHTADDRAGRLHTVVQATARGQHGTARHSMEGCTRGVTPKALRISGF